MHEELSTIVKSLQRTARKCDKTLLCTSCKRLDEMIDAADAAFSGSWMGYHAYVDYAGLERPPPGTYFSSDWGFFRSEDNWMEVNPDEFLEDLATAAKKPTLDELMAEANATKKAVVGHRERLLSIVEACIAAQSDDYFVRIKKALDGSFTRSVEAHIRLLTPGRISSHDPVAVGQRVRIPPHINLHAQINAVKEALRTPALLVTIAQSLLEHLRMKQAVKIMLSPTGKMVFIGHGRSLVWMQLDKFLTKRLNLETDEFESVSTAGGTVVDRLKTMLDAAGFAFIVATGEDETATGASNPRLNVVHEIGLFQGRLGFEKAIVLLEEGCSKFSNIDGIIYISFPKGNLAPAFEKVRHALEAAGLVSATS